MAEWLAAGAGAISAIGNIFGASRANKTSLKAIGKQYEYQKELSSTALQRTVKDAKAAGINPLYAVGGGGASTPSGGLPNIQNELSGLDELSKAATAYQQYKMGKEQIKATEENTALLKEQREKVKAEINQILQGIKINEPKEKVNGLVTQVIDNIKDNSIINNWKKGWNGGETSAEKSKRLDEKMDNNLIDIMQKNNVDIKKDKKRLDFFKKLSPQEKLRVTEAIIKRRKYKNRHK